MCDGCSMCEWKLRHRKTHPEGDGPVEGQQWRGPHPPHPPPPPPPTHPPTHRRPFNPLHKPPCKNWVRTPRTHPCQDCPRRHHTKCHIKRHIRKALFAAAGQRQRVRSVSCPLVLGSSRRSWELPLWWVGAPGVEWNASRGQPPDLGAQPLPSQPLRGEARSSIGWHLLRSYLPPVDPHTQLQRYGRPRCVQRPHSRCCQQRHPPEGQLEGGHACGGVGGRVAERLQQLAHAWQGVARGGQAQGTERGTLPQPLQWRAVRRTQRVAQRSTLHTVAISCAILGSGGAGC